jgi:hypothetical protein
MSHTVKFLFTMEDKGVNQVTFDCVWEKYKESIKYLIYRWDPTFRGYCEFHTHSSFTHNDLKSMFKCNSIELTPWSGTMSQAHAGYIADSTMAEDFKIDLYPDGFKPTGWYSPQCKYYGV